MHEKQERLCIACREHKNQNQMLRIARIENEYIFDFNFKLGGRGAYICKDKACLSLTIKKRLLNRAFKTNIDSSVYVRLGEYEQNN